MRPISSGADRNLRYGEWELTRREMTETAAGGDIGYIHLRAMGAGDMDDFVKQFYPIFNRKGLILDVRHNNGGNIDSWVLEKLLRKAWMYWQGRSGGPTIDVYKRQGGCFPNLYFDIIYRLSRCKIQDQEGRCLLYTSRCV